MTKPSFDDLEAWRPVVGWEGFYEVSSLGRVRSLRHTNSRWYAGRILTPSVEHCDYPQISLNAGSVRETKKIHWLVAQAFLGPCPEGMEVRHLDGDHLNCAWINLAYGTHGENERDKVQHGTHYQASKTHCPHDHEYTPDNTYINKRGARECRACKRRRSTLAGGRPSRATIRQKE